MLFNPTFGKVRQPPAERVRFILILKMLGPLLAWPGERLGWRVPFPTLGDTPFHACLAS